MRPQNVQIVIISSNITSNPSKPLALQISACIVFYELHNTIGLLRIIVAVFWI